MCPFGMKFQDHNNLNCQSLGVLELVDQKHPTAWEGGGAGRRSTNSNCWTQSLRWERLSGGGGGAMITNYEAPCDTVLDL